MAPLKYPLKTATDIQIPIPEADKTVCKLCGVITKNANALAGHIGAKHKIKFEDYLVNQYMSGSHPCCQVCDTPTRYLRGEYVFKKYCTEHANESRKEWSLQKGFGNNGFDHLWRKGETKHTNESIAKQAESQTGRDNPAFLSHIDFEAKLQKLSESNIKLEMDYSNYFSMDQAVAAECMQCSRKIVKKFVNLINNPSCPSCSSGRSQEEQEVYNFILSLSPDAKRNVRKVIEKELDIYCENNSSAVEYNGLYWHTEDKVGQNYHHEKTSICNKNNISLFHIFSDEWQNKKNIVQSMIRYRMHKTGNTVYARDCQVYETNSNKDLSAFFNETHISGHTNFIKAFYLKSDDQIVCALSVRKSFHKKYSDYIEIARFSSSLDTNVAGGFGKLFKRLKRWCAENNIKKILTYADLRFGKGDVYLKNGFILAGKTDIDYWYTDGKIRFNRFQYRAQPGKTEKQVANEAGVKRIYGCGSNIYEYLL
jgi:hypothetical protein